MKNEITIDGEVYIKESHIPERTLKKLGKIEEKPWPQEGDKYYYYDLCVDKVFSNTYSAVDTFAKKAIRKGNFFRTEEGAQMYSLRIESLSKGFMPNDDQEEFFYTWDWQDNEPACQDCRGLFWLMQPKFRKREECQEWYNQYGKSWECLTK